MKTGRQAGPPPNRTGSQGGDSPQPGQRLLGRALEPKPERQLTGATRVRPGQTPTSAKVGPKSVWNLARIGPESGRTKTGVPEGRPDRLRTGAASRTGTALTTGAAPNRSSLPEEASPKTGPPPESDGSGQEAPNRGSSPHGDRSHNRTASRKRRLRAGGSEPGQLPAREPLSQPGQLSARGPLSQPDRLPRWSLRTGPAPRAGTVPETRGLLPAANRGSFQGGDSGRGNP